VLSLAEAPLHPHNLARGSFVQAHGLLQPAPAPRFSRTPSAPVQPLPVADQGAQSLQAWGWQDEAIHALQTAGVMR
jgi:alpha-methylacyl-CoA racemase